MKRQTALLSYTLLAVLLALLLSGQRVVDDNGLYQYLRLFNEVLNRVQATYVEEDSVTAEKLIVGAINGMLATIGDPYTRLIPPKKYEEVKEDTVGEFGGLGIVITDRDGFITIISPMAGTPAFKVGLLPGDRIVAIDEENSINMEINEAVKRMRGNPGTSVTLTIRRAGTEDFSVQVERANIKYRTVDWQELGEGIGYIRLNSFNEHAGIDLVEALAELQETELTGLVFDLRNNPGGLYQEAGLVADVFLRDGLIVYTMGRDQIQRRKISARDDGYEPDIPMVVLINEGSASASEIVTGALKDLDRATIVGSRSFGKGVVQSVTNVGLEYGLAVTTERYYTPSGICIDHDGIPPHYQVETEKFGDTYVVALVSLNSSDTFINFVNESDGFSAENQEKLRVLLQGEGIDIPARLMHWAFQNQLAIKDGRAFVGDLENDRQLRFAYDFLSGNLSDTEISAAAVADTE